MTMVPQHISGAAGESFVARFDCLATQSLRPGVLARLTACLRAGSLDRALVGGADPADSAALAARAATLTSWRTRKSVAEGLERALRAAQGPQRRWWAVTPRSPLLQSASQVAELARLLRADTPLYARGIAMLNQLLTDGSGPAYCGEPDAVARRLGQARAAMLRSA